MHGNVDATVEERLLQLLDEDTASSDLTKWTRAVTVARRGDGNERDLDARPAQARRSELGLREREPTAAGTDADQHGTRCAWRASDRTADACARARRRSAPGRGAGGRSGSPTSTLVLETEEVTHRISINHAVGCRGRLFHPDCRQMQEFVQNCRGYRLGSATLRIVELRRGEAPRRESVRLERAGR